MVTLRLNLGCGTDWMANGVVNIDRRDLIPPAGITFLRADVADLRDMFADGAAAEIWAKDILEHFPQGQTGAVLDEWVRLLAPGGTLHVKTPELYAMAQFILHGAEGDEVKAARVYGGQDYPQNFHRAGFSRTSLGRLLEARGLRVLRNEICEGTNLLIMARKDGLHA